LASRHEHDLRLGDGEVAHDAVLGVALIASKRAALFGRAPCVYDIEFALGLWGFLDDITAEQQDLRRRAFSSVSHDYVAQRALVDQTADETLRQTPAQARLAAFAPAASATAA
jgi:hypothetical protein